MKVKCINNIDIEKCFTIGKTYDVIDEDAVEYEIIDDEGDVYWWEKFLFKPVLSRMKVKCIDNINIEKCFTIGKTYDVIEEDIDEDDIEYKIIDDEGDIYWWGSFLFKPALAEMRNDKINKLLEDDS